LLERRLPLGRCGADNALALEYVYQFVRRDTGFTNNFDMPRGDFDVSGSGCKCHQWIPLFVQAENIVVLDALAGIVATTARATLVGNNL
jgi:hypothetical protein